jgi:hypothetical protein
VWKDIKMKDFLEFALDLGKRESNRRYEIVNTLGYMGFWQFGKPRIYDCGYSLDGWKPKGRPVLTVISKQEFLNNPALQNKIFEKHVDMWVNAIERKYKKYDGKVYGDITISVSGMVGGLHLKGEGSAKYPGLKQFLETGASNKDGYGTEITEYVKRFGGYDLHNKERWSKVKDLSILTISPQQTLTEYAQETSKMLNHEPIKDLT